MPSPVGAARSRPKGGNTAVSLANSLGLAIGGAFPYSPLRMNAAGVVESRFGSPRDFVALTKPRVTSMVIVTAGVGALLAPGSIAVGALLRALLGTVLVVGSANALNMWWERDLDGLMSRTAKRPLPAGRMSAEAALAFGLLLGAIATPLLFSVNGTTGWLGLFALVSYVLVYTPLKMKTPFALQIGAVPGAIPPLLGWTAVTGRMDQGALVLFGILFLWQIPHFVAISLFRRKEYARAGLRVYAVARSEANCLATMIGYTVALVALSVAPFVFGMSGPIYLGVAAVLGLAFLALTAKGLWAGLSAGWAKKVFAFSILYLLALLVVLVADRIVQS
jgi:protoheme IX farnesyltransferase